MWQWGFQSTLGSLISGSWFVSHLFSYSNNILFFSPQCSHFLSWIYFSRCFYLPSFLPPLPPFSFLTLFSRPLVQLSITEKKWIIWWGLKIARVDAVARWLILFQRETWIKRTVVFNICKQADASHEFRRALEQFRRSVVNNVVCKICLSNSSSGL